MEEDARGGKSSVNGCWNHSGFATRWQTMKVWTCKANNRGVWQKSFETLIFESINAAGAWVVGAKSNAWTGHFDWNHSSSCLRGFRRDKESSTANGVAKTRCQGQRSHSALDFQPVWVCRLTKLERTLAKAAKKAWWNPTRWGVDSLLLLLFFVDVSLFHSNILPQDFFIGDVSWSVQHRWRVTNPLVQQKFVTDRDDRNWSKQGSRCRLSFDKGGSPVRCQNFRTHVRFWRCSMFAICTAIQMHLPELQGDWHMGQNQDNMEKSLSATNYSGSGALLCGWKGGADEPDQWGCREINFWYRYWNFQLKRACGLLKAVNPSAKDCAK